MLLMLEYSVCFNCAFHVTVVVFVAAAAAAAAAVPWRFRWILLLQKGTYADVQIHKVPTWMRLSIIVQCCNALYQLATTKFLANSCHLMSYRVPAYESFQSTTSCYLHFWLVIRHVAQVGISGMSHAVDSRVKMDPRAGCFLPSKNPQTFWQKNGPSTSIE